MKFNSLYLLMFIFLLGACAETELVSHAVKNVPGVSAAPSKSQGTFKVGKPYKIAGKTYVPKESYSHTETGMASWYGPNFHGKKTANGEIFDKYQLTAAHRTLQMPSLIRVTNLKNGRSIVLRVNDRGPFSKNRVLDVSERAAELLGFKNDGTTKVKIQVLSKESEALAESAKRGEDTRGVEVSINENRLIRSQTRTSVRSTQANTLSSKGLKIEAAHPAPVKPQSKPILDGSPKVAQAPQNIPFAGPSIYVQAGAFGNESNALSFANSLSSFGNAKVYPGQLSNGEPLYRVRIGPVSNEAAASTIVASLADSGKANALIVVD